MTGQNVDTTPPPVMSSSEMGKFGKSDKFVESIKILRIRPAPLLYITLVTFELSFKFNTCIVTVLFAYASGFP